MQWDEKAVKRYRRLMFTRHFAALAAGPAEDHRAAAAHGLRQPRGERGARSAARRDRLLRQAASPTRELKREVDALAGFLQQRCGVARGDRVLLYVQNSPQFVIAYYAILRADAVVVPVNPMNRTEELRHYVEDSERAVAIVGQDVLRADRAAARAEARAGRRLLGLPRRERPTCRCRTSCARRARRFLRACSTGTRRSSAGLQPGAHLAQPDDLAVMPYTSGTTGKPKGCMHTHASVQATTVAYLYWRGAQDQQRGAVGAADVPRHRHAGRHERADPPRRHAGGAVALGPRLRRRCRSSARG